MCVCMMYVQICMCMFIWLYTVNLITADRDHGLLINCQHFTSVLKNIIPAVKKNTTDKSDGK